MTGTFIPKVCCETCLFQKPEQVNTFRVCNACIFTLQKGSKQHFQFNDTVPLVVCYFPKLMCTFQGVNIKSFSIHFVCCRSESEILANVGFIKIFKCLGKLYEHERRDRDKYVDIFWENIRPGKSFN